jgi:hypothetical protein
MITYADSVAERQDSGQERAEQRGLAFRHPSDASPAGLRSNPHFLNSWQHPCRARLPRRVRGARRV